MVDASNILTKLMPPTCVSCLRVKSPFASSSILVSLNLMGLVDVKWSRALVIILADLMASFSALAKTLFASISVLSVCNPTIPSGSDL